MVPVVGVVIVLVRVVIRTAINIAQLQSHVRRHPSPCK